MAREPLPVPLIVLLPVVTPAEEPTALDPGFGSDPAVRVELSPVGEKEGHRCKYEKCKKHLIPQTDISLSRAFSPEDISSELF